MRRLLCILAAVVLLSPSADVHARGIDPVADSVSLQKIRSYLDSVRVVRNRPTVALVLSGGGAKGAAHIGLIRRLEELDIPVDIVVGTSMGGLVGGMFSMGYDSYEMEDVVVSADWGRLIKDKKPQKYMSLQDRNFKAQHQIRLPFWYGKKQFVMRKENDYSESGSKYKPLSFDARKEDEEQLLRDNLWESLPFGVVKGQNVANLISSLTAGYQQDMDFMDLPIPYFCVATDLISFKGKYWFDGKLPTALRTTMSIPFLFDPVKADGMVLVDGGMRDNYPTAVMRSLGADYIIGMELSDPRKSYQEVNNVGDVANQMIDLLIADNYERNKDVADVKVKPDLHEFNMLSFSDENIRTIIDRGYATACAADSALLSIKRIASGDSLVFHGPKATNLMKDKARFEEIVISGVTSKQARMLSRKLKIRGGSWIGSAEIEDAVNTLYATGAFETVTYEVYGDEEPFVLDLKCAKGPISQLGIGARFDTEEVLSVLLDVGFGVRKLTGAKANISVRVAESPSAKIRLYLDSRMFPTLNLEASVQYTNVGRVIPFVDARKAGIPEDRNVLRRVQKDPLAAWRTNADLYLSGIRWRCVDFRAGARLEYDEMIKCSTAESFFRGGYGFANQRGAYLSAYASVVTETLDRMYFPERGHSLTASYEWGFAALGQKDFKGYHIAGLDAKVVIPAGRHFSVIPSVAARMALGNDVPYFQANYVGGSLPGRYFPQQIPFMGVNNFAAMAEIFTMARLDLRAKIKDVHYISLIGNYGRDCDKFANYLTYSGPGFYGVGLEYSYNTILGPLSANVHYSSITRNPGFYVSFGVLF